MRHLTVGEVLELYSRVMKQSGGSVGILNLGALESAVAQPRMTFNGKELYPRLWIKHRLWDTQSLLGITGMPDHAAVLHPGKCRDDESCHVSNLILQNKFSYKTKERLDEHPAFL